MDKWFEGQVHALWSVTGHIVRVKVTGSRWKNVIIKDMCGSLPEWWTNDIMDKSKCE